MIFQNLKLAPTQPQVNLINHIGVSFKYNSVPPSIAVGMPVGRHSGGQLATTLVATIVKTQRNSTQLNSTQSNSKATSVEVRHSSHLEPTPAHSKLFRHF